VPGDRINGPPPGGGMPPARRIPGFPPPAILAGPRAEARPPKPVRLVRSDGPKPGDTHALFANVSVFAKTRLTSISTCQEAIKNDQKVIKNDQKRSKTAKNDTISSCPS
jgi:hypothetical protein